ncbi:hypothetical protein CRG98_018976 [Punica granatum]|uniref:Uncharacterized protein n=1 Tax=Punica granatum TaxID=22663 RepID=A0A2I0JYV4_PUNGR|nr:hypothetical protein CRG98_018976 [Punica granatum]
MQGKSRGSVRESGYSVERLEGCSGAKDARSGKDGRAAGPARAHGRSVGARERARWGVWRADGRHAGEHVVVHASACGYGCTVHPRALENVIFCLGIRGKSRGSVRESGDSVERLEECSGATACTFGKLGERGVRLDCTGGVREASGARGTQLACAGARGARLYAGTRLGVRLDVRERAATGALFTREHVLHPE